MLRPYLGAFSGVNCPGLIEAMTAFSCQSGLRQSFPGLIAPASLKLLAIQFHVALRHEVFRG